MKIYYPTFEGFKLLQILFVIFEKDKDTGLGLEVWSLPYLWKIIVSQLMGLRLRGMHFHILAFSPAMRVPLGELPDKSMAHLHLFTEDLGNGTELSGQYAIHVIDFNSLA